MSNSNSPKREITPKSYEHEYSSMKKPKTRKANMLWVILDLIFIVIFNIFFFVIGGTEHITSVWMSYGFIHFAYFMLVITPFLTKKSRSSALLGFSLYSISALYFFAALAWGVAFIIIALESYAVPLLVQLSLAGIYGMLLISNMLANEKTANDEEERQPQVLYVKNATAQLKGILDKVKDGDTKRKVESAYDIMNSSPVKSHTKLAQMEQRILTLIDELEDAASKGEKQAIISSVDSLIHTVKDRNNRLRSYYR